MMRKARCKCACGEYAYLYHIDRPGRIGSQFTKVIAAPIYICSECDAQFSQGSDSILYTQRVREAIEQQKSEIWFEENRDITGANE